jgi:hypothetical protein
MTQGIAHHQRTEQGSGPTVFLPGRKALEESGPRSGWTLSPDLRQQITRRLRLIAMLRSLRTIPLAEPWGDEQAEAWWAALRRDAEMHATVPPS